MLSLIDAGTGEVRKVTGADQVLAAFWSIDGKSAVYSQAWGGERPLPYAEAISAKPSSGEVY